MVKIEVKKNGFFYILRNMTVITIKDTEESRELYNKETGGISVVKENPTKIYIDWLEAKTEEKRKNEIEFTVLDNLSTAVKSITKMIEDGIETPNIELMALGLEENNIKATQVSWAKITEEIIKSKKGVKTAKKESV